MSAPATRAELLATAARLRAQATRLRNSYHATDGAAERDYDAVRELRSKAEQMEKEAEKLPDCSPAIIG